MDEVSTHIKYPAFFLFFLLIRYKYILRPAPALPKNILKENQRHLFYLLISTLQLFILHNELITKITNI